MLTPKVTNVEIPSLYVLRVTFEDGKTRLVDVGHMLHGTVFGPLCDEALFRQAYVDPIWHTVCWPNGADLAPEWLYESDPEKYWKRTDGHLHV
jgi:Protein of unknown function (DUF2442)